MDSSSRTRPARVERALAAMVMAALTLITGANVLMRYCTDVSFAMTEEVSVFLLLILTLVGAVSAFVEGRHVRITLVVEALPAWGKAVCSAYATKDEAVHYIDLLPNGLHRQYSSIQECKSVITTPSGGQTLVAKGFFNVSGLAWSGRGKIKQVDVSFDGGINWQTARLEGPIQNKALTRFNINWVWDGSPAILQSRAIDETGYVQPSYGQLRKVRGTKSIYHNNAIQSWKVVESGEVTNVQVL